MIICQRCGEINADNSSFCVRCEAPLASTKAIAKYPFYYKKSFWILIALALFISIGNIISFFNKKNDTILSNKNSQTEPVQKRIIQKNSGAIYDYDIEIYSCFIAYDYEDNPVAVITYNWTNNGNNAANFQLSFDDKAYQNGIECKKAYFLDDYADVDMDAERKNIQPEKTQQVQISYKLNDLKAPVDIEIKPLITFIDDPPTVARTFDIS